MTAFVGVQVAFNDGPLVVNPTWTDLSTLSGVSVTGWRIDRGRLSEFDQTGTGTATIYLHDKYGTLDPWYTSGTYAGKIVPGKQASIVLRNPVLSSGSTFVGGTVFRGFIEDWKFQPDLSTRTLDIEVNLFDAFARLNATMLVPGTAGDATTANGDVVYLGGDLVTPQDRIEAILADCNWPAELSEIFTGNVFVQGGTYAPNTSALAAMFDAADAEFPGVANLFVNKQGTVTFHGRMARFRPDVAEYRISQWNVGDILSFRDADSTIAVISDLSYNVANDSIVNYALATPQGTSAVAGSTIAGNLAVAAASIGTFGYCSWSAENLLTFGGIASNVGDAWGETALFSDYFGSNFSDAYPRIDKMEFTGPPPWEPTADRVWRLLCNADISDMASLRYRRQDPSLGPGGFTFEYTQDFFIEGLHYEASAQATSYHHVTLSLDVSPAQNYDVPTFGTTATT